MLRILFFLADKQALSRVSLLDGLYLINFDSNNIETQTLAIKEYNR